ncbi:1-acyl-sn-glycerol-3-phosphate acyltransferase [Candidatus Sumerlaeota bacterium]|nr:1-acyl-sn-glycerol-3-phosphate acyltransferase [Candidatus Sumerlaeota bacterium]
MSEAREKVAANAEAESTAPAQPSEPEAKIYHRAFPGWVNWLSYLFCRTSLWISAKIMFGVEVYGMDNIPRRGAVMLVANHSSHLDPPLCSIVTHRHLSFLAKADLFKSRWLGYLISTLGAFPVRRGEGDRGAIRTCIGVLKEGKALLIFPEGTRSPDGKPQEAKKGAAMILSQLPETLIVPVRIDGSFEAWGKDGKKINRTKIRITVGQGFRVADLKLQESGKKQLYHELGKEIMRKIMTASA